MAALLGAFALLSVATTVPETIETLAEQAGVEVVDLLGAVNTTGLTPAEYLYRVGALERPPPAEPAYGIWDRLAQCESGGDWHSASNPRYKGGIQADATFWAKHGGLAFAWRADYATRAQQIIVAERGLAAQGWSAWPVCSRRLGLR